MTVQLLNDAERGVAQARFDGGGFASFDDAARSVAAERVAPYNSAEFMAERGIEAELVDVVEAIVAEAEVDEPDVFEAVNVADDEPEPDEPDADADEAPRKRGRA